MQLFFRGYPTIRTDRLVLRQLLISDLSELYELYNARETQQFQTPHYYTQNDLFQYILTQEEKFNAFEKIMWVIERKSDRAFVGVRIIYNDGNDEYEIQGDTKKRYWRQGYTKESYLGILNFIKEAYGSKKATVYSKIRTDNENAIALINSLDFDFDKINYENGVPLIKYVKTIN
jgi:ribosomal-protein-alanine N-acetyltransferase